MPALEQFLGSSAGLSPGGTQRPGARRRRRCARFWSGLREVFPETREQRCWFYKSANVLAAWDWLLGTLGYVPFQDWTTGRSWRLDDTYLVIKQSPALTAGEHDHGWTLMFGDTHPYAGDKDHYAACLTNTDSYEVELVASDT